MQARRYKIYAIDNGVPVIDPTGFVHPDAVLIGDLVAGAGCYVGPCGNASYTSEVRGPEASDH